jgi:hypothetical protein
VSQLDLGLDPTPAERQRGTSSVWQCVQCGTLVCSDAGKPGACPACNDERIQWHHVELTPSGHYAGPFYDLRARHEYLVRRLKAIVELAEQDGHVVMEADMFRLLIQDIDRHGGCDA